MEKEILIRTKGLSRVFHTEFGEQNLLSDVNLQIYRGDFTVIMGASGSGKSTLLYHLSGLEPPSAGEVVFNGTEITGLSENQKADFRRKNCGFVFQQNCLVEELNVLDNVITAGLLSSSDKKKIIADARELLCRLGVSERTQTKYPSQISGGRAQRVSIARALIQSPAVIFADEPTGSLNSKASLKVMDIFTELNRAGQSIVMVTHSVASACRGSRILYLRDGKLLDECLLGEYDGDDDGRIARLNLFLGKMGW